MHVFVCVTPPPPPPHHPLQVTYTARLGALREKAQVFLGAFYGIPLVAPGNPGGSEFLPSLERQLLSRYLSARQDLEAELEAAGGSTAGEGEKAVQERVREKYQVCHVAQTRLARVRHLVSVVTEGDAPGLIDLEGSEVDYATLSLSQLYRLAGCLVNTMLILVAPGEKEGDEGAPSFTGNHLTLSILSVYYQYILSIVSVYSQYILSVQSIFQCPFLLHTDAVLGELEVTEDECRLLLSSLCVHGVLRVQGRMCALLLRLCGAQPWWGEMVVSTASHLFSSPTLIFNRKRFDTHTHTHTHTYTHTYTHTTTLYTHNNIVHLFLQSPTAAVCSVSEESPADLCPQLSPADHIFPPPSFLHQQPSPSAPVAPSPPHTLTVLTHLRKPHPLTPLHAHSERPSDQRF